MPTLLRQPEVADPNALRAAWAAEYAAARSTADPAAAWHHLERAHILSQPLPVPHVRTHLTMLGHGLRQRDGREVLGQVSRTLVAAAASASGRYPLGNTGAARVSAVAPMPIPEDLRPLLTKV